MVMILTMLGDLPGGLWRNIYIYIFVIDWPSTNTIEMLLPRPRVVLPLVLLLLPLRLPFVLFFLSVYDLHGLF